MAALPSPKSVPESEAIVIVLAARQEPSAVVVEPGGDPAGDIAAKAIRDGDTVKLVNGWTVVFLADPLPKPAHRGRKPLGWEWHLGWGFKFSKKARFHYGPVARSTRSVVERAAYIRGWRLVEVDAGDSVWLIRVR